MNLACMWGRVTEGLLGERLGVEACSVWILQNTAGRVLRNGQWRQGAPCKGCARGRVSGASPTWPGQLAGRSVGALQVSSRELVCRSCLKKTLHRLEDMMRILQAETATGAGTPTTIADSILNITGAPPRRSLPPPLP